MLHFAYTLTIPDFVDAVNKILQPGKSKIKSPIYNLGIW